ncbi:Uncharacterized protein OBRU01_03186 [Operophtera brumata]|uniref:Tyrosine-protein phosphatase domain-containing protein n=1 Tax=Operophtera brumata TaxID=104452 RepID=A0A0L7LRB3_OPEBR|nr:Uncharacterized protein OBRU01_03186 [Operophtera brumata]
MWLRRMCGGSSVHSWYMQHLVRQRNDAGAAIVVNILLLCNAPVEGVALPNGTTPTTVKDVRAPRYKPNATWPARNIQKTLDVALNELTPKESTSEEHTENNAKYKNRGSTRFGSRKTSTVSPKRRRATTSTSSTESATLIIVTPTPEVKNPTQIIDSMRKYKKTKMPNLSSTTPVSVKEAPSFEDNEDEEDDSFEKFTSDKYHDNFFTNPSFDDDHDFSHDFDNDSSNNKVKKDNRGPSYNFPNYSKEDTYSYKEDKEPFKSSFFDYDSELTTPRNDFFDKKYSSISTSIIKNLDSIKAKSPPPNVTNVHKIITENIGLERLSNNTPTNKSSVFIKNTKEIRMSDNDGADSVNKELSDVHGTSIYYEMSVLSTETYTMNHSNDDDCDESSPTTTSTVPENERGVVKATQPTIEVESTKPSIIQAKSEALSTSPSDFVPVSSLFPFFSTVHSYSTQSSISTTERITKLFSNNRNRNYSKRLNPAGIKDSLNSVTSKTDGNVTVRPQTRKFHHTTPRTKPVWMSPRRNITRIYAKPTTIYSEHFSIKDKFLTSKPLQPNRADLTTVSSSEIDPVLQTDVSGTSKVVNSQFVTDNTIPSLRKRGSMRFKTSTASSAEVESDIRDLEMPSTAWALASLISPPSLPSTVVNATENELQKVGEEIDTKEIPTGPKTTSTVSPISNDIITKKVTEVDQNKLPWQPVYTPTSPNEENKITAEIKERLPAESNISLQSSADLVATEAVKDNTLGAAMKSKEVKPLWISATVETAATTDKNEINKEKRNKIIPPIDTTRSTGFESITKLPADVTTPLDETAASSEVNQTVSVDISKLTTDYEITTIRFSYVPTETVDEITDINTIKTTTESEWHSAMPTRTKATTIKDSPVTTYRPKYTTSTETEEMTTIFTDTTPVLEVSSQIVANLTEKTPETTERTMKTTEVTTQPTAEVTTEAITVPPTTVPTTTVEVTTEVTTAVSTIVPTTEMIEDTTTIVVEVITEISSEKSTSVTVSTTETITSSETETDSTSEENSHSNEINYEIKTNEPSVKPEPEYKSTSTMGAPMAAPTTHLPTFIPYVESDPPTVIKETTEPMTETTTAKTERDETTTEDVTMTMNELEDLTSYAGEVTTESAPRGPEEAGLGAAIAIVVSTTGVIALLVVRRRGRRGVYAQRCTPVSLDAYSLDSVSVGHRKGNHRLRASKRSYGNPAYDDEVTSHPMQYPALASFALDVDSMTAEFAEIPSISVKGEEVPPGCEDKNRYSNVLPLPETRVPLQRINNDPTTEYINASYVTNSRLVVMLTEYMENGVVSHHRALPVIEVSHDLTKPACQKVVMMRRYNKRSFGDFKVILKKREQRDKYAVSSVQLINMATRTWREVTHLWYFWPAKGVPEDYDSVIEFLFEMRSYMKVAQTAKEFDEEGQLHDTY